MIPVNKKLTDELEQLLDMLDADIQSLQQTLLRLDHLRALVVKHDNQGLTELLEAIREESQDFAPGGSTRTCLRNQFSPLLGCSPEEVTLHRLAQNLPEGKRAQLLDKDRRLKSLADRLKAEYAATVELLSDCARFNRLLLNAVLNRPGDTVTYDSTGTDRKNSGTRFVDLKY